MAMRRKFMAAFKAKVALFAEWRATGMIHYADLIAHATRRYYGNGDPTFFDIMAAKFDAVGGVMHGLVLFMPADAQCGCFVCRQPRGP